jgi:PEP-CTERM motif
MGAHHPRYGGCGELARRLAYRHRNTALFAMIKPALSVFTFAVLATLAQGAQAAAGQTAGVQITYDDSFHFVNAIPVDEGKLLGLQDFDDTVFVSALMNPDPYIDAGAYMRDAGTPSEFSFSFILPIVPTIGPVDLTLQFSARCNAMYANGCAMAPTLASGALADALLNGTVVLSGGSAFASDITGQGSFASTLFNLRLPTITTYSLLGLNVGFQGTGDASAYEFTARAEVLTAAVPEPATYALLLGGLLLIGGYVRSRQR